jgi:hypothetical protein
MKRQVMTRKLSGRTLSTHHRGSQPPMRTGSAISLCTNPRLAQNRPAPTIVDTIVVRLAAKGCKTLGTTSDPVDRFRCRPSREAMIAPRKPTHRVRFCT